MKRIISFLLSLSLLCGCLIGLTGCQNKKSISILAIGSSYLRNSMDQAYPILQSLGYEEIYLGNIYSSGCKINAHISNIENDRGAYEYRTIVDGKLQPKGVTIDGVRYEDKYKMSDALAERKWDFVIINQGATEGGVEETYEKLPEYFDYVKSKTQGAKYLFNAGWTFSNLSTLPEFSAYYQSSEDVMYQMIIDTLKSKVEPLNFYKIIPSVTVMRNARTSKLDELRLTYDPQTYGHATEDFGRYMVGLSLVASVTGEDISSIKYKPETVTDEEKAIAIESVVNALNNPFEQTQSNYK